MLFTLPKILIRKWTSKRTFKMIIKTINSIFIQIWMISRLSAIIYQWKNSLNIIKEVLKNWGMRMIKILDIKWKKQKVWRQGRNLQTGQDQTFTSLSTEINLKMKTWMRTIFSKLILKWIKITLNKETLRTKRWQ